MKTALSRAQNTSFWMGYSFNVRPGVTFDSYNRQTKRFTEAVTPAAEPETRNAGVFFLHDPDRNSITRLELYNLNRRHEFGGNPVYWLGHAESNESLKLLQSIITESAAPQVAEQATNAIASHDGTEAVLAIKELLLSSSNQKARTTAAFWYGQVGTDTSPLLAQLARDDKEYTELRKQAAFTLGVSKDKNSFNTLHDLYNAVANREVKEQILFAVSVNEAKDQSIDFLIKTAQTEPDREIRKRALFWLGQKAERTLPGLRDVTASADAGTDTQAQAVFAISQRSPSEAVPELINLAKIHPHPEIRKQAIFWLSQTGDERALEFFKQLLMK